jgi:transposase-like protein
MRRYTINKFNKQFPNDDACLEWLKNNHYPDGIHCTTCKKITKHHKIAKRPAYACDYCGNHVYPMAGTIFEKSVTSSKLWFYAIFLMTATRCGISAKQIERETGVTYKTAWRMFNAIRKILTDDIQPTQGKFEVDETYIGGKAPGKRGRGAGHKSIVVGVVKRKGSVYAKRTADVKKKSIYPIVQDTVLPTSTVYTDELKTYDSIHRLGYKHIRVNHSDRVWVVDDAHTNTIEGFWSLVKRGINGVYHSVSEKWLQNYLNEYSFRFNHRNDETPMFLTVLRKL